MLLVEGLVSHDRLAVELICVVVVLRAAWFLPDWLEKWQRLAGGRRRAGRN